MKENRHQVREAQSPKQTHIFNSIIKMPKVKNTERIFKVAREKAASYIQGIPNNTIGHFSAEIVGQKKGHNIFRVMKGKLQPRILCPARSSFGTEGDSFPDKQKLQNFITTKPSAQEMLNKLL